MGTAADIDNLVAQETGRRVPASRGTQLCISSCAIIWAIFQMWIASPLQYNLASFTGWDFIIFNDLAARKIHLSFALILSFILFPATMQSSRYKVPWYDWFFLATGAFAILYTYALEGQLIFRPASPNKMDIMVSFLGVLSLLEAVRRTVGISVSVIALIFLLYTRFGECMFTFMSHKNFSIDSMAAHYWLSPEGVFGSALGVSTNFVFLYVLFGAMIEKSGAGNFLIQLSFSLLGRFVGGPAKAAVIASGLMGMISGSSIANTVTVGSFTIPLMKKMGLSSEKAGAIEVSAGISAQIMPPVMGAAAFVMAEYIGLPYIELIKHAFFPALLVYIALLYIVHLEAVKQEDALYSRKQYNYSFYVLLRACIIMCLFIIVCGIFYFLISAFCSIPAVRMFIDKLASPPMSLLLFFLCYILCLRYEAQFADLPELKYDVTELKISDVFKVSIHFLLPIFVLVWCLTISRLSPQLAAYWTIMALALTIISQDCVKNYFRTGLYNFNRLKAGFSNCVDSLVAGSRNMVVVSIATAGAGIVVGSISLTGVGFDLGDIIESLSHGNLFISLVITAVVCIVLGMGMPTTACYIIVATLMVPVLSDLMQKNAIFAPKLSLHLFVFYFGLMADVTPPIGLASYAAAAISGGDPVKTGIKAFVYNLRTLVLPFVFVFNPTILLYDVESFLDVASLVTSAVAGILVVSAGTQGYFICKSKRHESCMLFFLGIGLLFPNFVVDKFLPRGVSELRIESHYNDALPMNKDLVVKTEMKIYDNVDHKSFIIPLQEKGALNEHLARFGLLFEENGKIQKVLPGTDAELLGLSPNYVISDILLYSQRLHDLFIVVPLIVCIGLILVLQKMRSGNND